MRHDWPVFRLPDLPETAPVRQTRLIGVQMDVRIGEAKANLDVALGAIEQGRALGGTLFAFPECALTGYCFRNATEARDAALDADGPELQALTRVASEGDILVAMGYLERTPSGFANSVSLIGPGGVLATYRKTHLPHLGVDKWTEPGCDRFAAVDAGDLRVGMLICFDASFPEATRLLALDGADLVLLPTNWPDEASAKSAWLPNTRAYENVIYFASVNRVGEERGYHFRGRSRICGVEGQVLADGPVDTEGLLVADIDPQRARTKRIVRREGEYWLDRIGQRREDLYRLSSPDGVK